MAILLLKDVTATGPSRAIKVFQIQTHTAQISFTGAITAMTVNLEGTVDDVKDPTITPKWFPLAIYPLDADDIAAKSAMIHAANKVVSGIRLNVTSLTGAGTIQGLWLGDQLTARS